MNESPQILRPLHVLTLTPFYPNSRNEVAGCFVAEPLDRMGMCQVDCSVFAVQPLYRRKSSALAEYPARWSRYISLPGGLGLSSAGAFLFAEILSQVRQLHREKPISLIHAHAALPCGHAAWLLARRLRVPFVVTVHGLDAYATNQAKGRAGEWCRRVSRDVYRSAAHVICISESVRQKVLELIKGECAASVVYNGVDAQMFAPSNEPGHLRLLSVGNLIPIKGHELLLRALALVHQRIPEVSCEIVGEGPELPRLKSLSERLNIAGQVQFSGRRTRAEVAEALRDCSIFVLASCYEGLGCAYLEAMAAARPIVACRGQGIAEVVEHGKNGWLVAPDDPDELASSLIRLLEDEELRRRIRWAAHRTIVEGLTLEHQAQRLSRLYRECAA